MRNNTFIALLATVFASASAMSVSCPDTHTFSKRTCGCVYNPEKTCRDWKLRCPSGEYRDPREQCGCAPLAEVLRLYEHPGLDDNCNRIPEPEPEPEPEYGFDCDRFGRK